MRIWTKSPCGSQPHSRDGPLAAPPPHGDAQRRQESKCGKKSSWSAACLMLQHSTPTPSTGSAPTSRIPISTYRAPAPENKLGARGIRHDSSRRIRPIRPPLAIRQKGKMDEHRAHVKTRVRKPSATQYVSYKSSARLPLLQSKQSVQRLSGVDCPPFETGTIWSISSSTPSAAERPQILHRYPSLFMMAKRTEGVTSSLW